MTASWCGDLEPHTPHYEPMPSGVFIGLSASWCDGSPRFRVVDGAIVVISNNPNRES